MHGMLSSLLAACWAVACSPQPLTAAAFWVATRILADTQAPSRDAHAAPGVPLADPSHVTAGAATPEIWATNCRTAACSPGRLFARAGPPAGRQPNGPSRRGQCTAFVGGQHWLVLLYTVWQLQLIHPVQPGAASPKVFFAVVRCCASATETLTLQLKCQLQFDSLWLQTDEPRRTMS